LLQRVSHRAEIFFRRWSLAQGFTNLFQSAFDVFRRMGRAIDGAIEPRSLLEELGLRRTVGRCHRRGLLGRDFERLRAGKFRHGTANLLEHANGVRSRDGKRPVVRGRLEIFFFAVFMARHSCRGIAQIPRDALESRVG